MPHLPGVAARPADPGAIGAARAPGLPDAATGLTLQAWAAVAGYRASGLR